MAHILKNIRYYKNLALINGKWVQGRNRKTFPVYNPTNGEILSHVPNLNNEDVSEAIEKADEAFQSWKHSSCYERSNLLKDLARNMVMNKNDLATIICLENGKPITEALGEVKLAASFLEWYGEEAKRINGEILPIADSKIRRHVLKQPIGVCGLITPWNHPLALMTRMVGGAIAAGCTSILKPSEETPLTSLAFGKFLEEVNAPPGVVNIITCSRDNLVPVGKLLCDHETIRKIAFTGSTKVGKWLLKRSAETVKHVSMELGGNAPFIVFNSANVKVAAECALKIKFKNAGQTCSCPQRFFVEDKIYDAFMEEFQRLIATKIKIGDPLHNDTTFNCLINQQSADRIQNQINDALINGATITRGGKLVEEGTLRFEPTIVENCNAYMKCMREETFGPVAYISRFQTEDEVIKLANNIKEGLAGYFFSDNYRQIARVSEALQVGMVGVNETNLPSEMIPFGGVKESGLGREGSTHGINEYLEMKYVFVGDHH